MKKDQAPDLLTGTRKTAATHMVSDDFDPKAFRKALKLNRQDFWKKLGTTQSGGSRYETEHRLPDPIRLLMPIVYPVPDEYLIPIR